MPISVAILMSTYNGEKYVRQQIDSILHLITEATISLIVRDDGSTDSTCSILNQYQQEGKLVWTQGDNIGVGKSFLTLLKENPGYDYYAFSDQDDVWYPEKIQRGIETIKDLKIPALYFSNGKLVDANLNPFGRNVNRKIRDNSINMETAAYGLRVAQGCASLFNKELANIIIQHSIPNFLLHDLVITMVCSMTGGVIIYDPKPSFKYRLHGKNEVGLNTKSQLGFLGIIKHRLQIILSEPRIKYSQKASEALEIYGDVFSKEGEAFCKSMIKAESSFWERIKLAFSPKIRCWTRNVGLTWRLRMLFGHY